MIVRSCADGEGWPSKVGVNPVLNNFYKSEGKSVTTIESIAYKKYICEEASRVEIMWNPLSRSARVLIYGNSI